jgi:hypothetical protein
MQITDTDRDEHGNIMVDAQRKAAARETPPEVPAPDEPARTRRLSNRRGHAEPARPAASHKQIGGILGGLLAFLVLFVLGARLLPSTAPLADRAAPTTATTDDRRPTTDQPAAAPTIAPSTTPEPPTATPEPPTQTPAVVYVEVAPPCDVAVNPLYSVQLDVYADGGRPIGIARGVSCDSQANAEANAAAIAAEMKKGAKP